MGRKEIDNRQELFNYMSNQHGLTLLDSELNDIYSICIGHEEYVKMLNFILSDNSKVIATIQAELEKELQTSLNHFNAMTLAMFELEKAKELLRECQERLETILVIGVERDEVNILIRKLNTENV